MPKILITGNGFDLNLGLPTHYSDFIKILNYIESGRKIDFEKVYLESLNFENIKNNFNQFEFDVEKIKLLKKEINTNLWFNFFRDELEIETWIDFENKIEYVIKILFSSIKQIEDEVFSSGSVSSIESYGPSLFKGDIEAINVLKKFNIISHNLIGNISLNKELFTKKHGYFTKVDLEITSNNLLAELISFKKMFNYYFELFVFPFYKNLNKSLDTNRYKSFDRHYTFNYTPTFEKVYGQNNITSFLHGKINSLENKIVLGINKLPEVNFEIQKFIHFTKSFQKANMDTDYKFIKEYDKNMNNDYHFFFFGLSMGNSDSNYIDEVFEFVKSLTSKNNQIIVIHHDNNSKANLIANLSKIRGQENIDELLGYGILKFLPLNSSELNKELNKLSPTDKRYSKIQIR